MRTTDSSGRPLRYVPRQPDPLREPQRTRDRAAPAQQEEVLFQMPAEKPRLPAEATDEESLYLLVNALRRVLLATALAVEEKG